MPQQGPSVACSPMSGLCMHEPIETMHAYRGAAQWRTNDGRANCTPLAAASIQFQSRGSMKRCTASLPTNTKRSRARRRNARWLGLRAGWPGTPRAARSADCRGARLRRRRCPCPCPARLLDRRAPVRCCDCEDVVRSCMAGRGHAAR
jgi:hypothetical protein